MIVLASLAGTFPLLAALHQPGTSTTNEDVEDLNGGHVYNPDRLLLVEGFEPGDNGWYLSPGKSGRLVYWISGQPNSRIGVNLWVYTSPGVTDAVLVSAPGLVPTAVATNANLVGDRLQLPERYAVASTLDIEIQASNSGSQRPLVIDQLVSFNIQGSDPRPPPVYSYLAFGALVGALALLFVFRRRHGFLIAGGVAVVSAIAAATRVLPLFLLNLPPDSDAVYYRIYGDRFQWWPLFGNGLFSGNFNEREPLYPMVVHAYFQVLGSSDFHLRVVSATLSIAVVIVSVVAARRRLVSWWGPILVGLLVATSGPLIQESYRGLRLELETLTVLALYLALDRGPANRPIVDALVVGVIGAAMVLTRTYFLPLFVAAVVVSFVIRYRPVRKAAGLIAIAIVIMSAAGTAHRIGLYQHHQDPFWDTTGYARWNANMELFGSHRPLPHPELFPSAADYTKFGPYYGPHLSTIQYLFVIHSPEEFVRDSLAGFHGIFNALDSYTYSVSKFGRVQRLPEKLVALLASAALRVDLAIQWLVLLGLMGMLIRAWKQPRLALIPVIIASWLGMTGFLFDHGLLEQYRHTWQTFPLAMVAAAWLVESAVILAARHIQIDRLRHQLGAFADLALFPIAIVLALVSSGLSGKTLVADAALCVLALAALSYRRPGLGVPAMLLSISISSATLGAGATVACAAAVALRMRPAPRALLPVAALLCLGLAVAVAGGRPSRPSLEFIVSMFFATGAVLVVAQDAAERHRLIWVLAAAGPLAGAAYILEPKPPVAVALIPVGAVAAAWLALQGRRWAAPLAIIDVALVVLVAPVAAWLGVLTAVAFLATGAMRTGAWSQLRRSRWAVGVAASAGLIGFALVAGGAALAATTPPTDAAWSSKLSDTQSSIRQQITVDRSGDNSLWIYGSRASANTDYPVRVDVNGVTVSDDLTAYLRTGQMTWIHVALPSQPHPGDRLDVELVATGNPNSTDRYIQVGGVYTTTPGLVSIGVDGTYLIVLGDDGLPLGPGGLPEPMVGNRLQPPMGEFMPGESAAPAAARQESGLLEIWSQTLQTAAHNPLGIGSGNLTAELAGLNAGVGPGLSARNEFLQAAAEWGALGIIGVLLMLGAAVWFAIRSKDKLLPALLIATVISMAGESIWLDTAGAAATWFVLGLCFAVTARRAASTSISPASGGEMQPETSRPEATHAG